MGSAAECDFGVLDDLGAAVWVQAYDAAWLSKDWTELGKYFAHDTAMMLAGGSAAIVGRGAVLECLRAIFTDAQIHEYNATDLTGYSSGPVGVISYRWQLDWTVDRVRSETLGRDILALRSLPDGWRLVWRTQVRS